MMKSIFEMRLPSRAARLLILSLAFGSLVAFVTPPLRGPDEISHFLRIYAYARGEFLPAVEIEGRKGIFVERELFQSLGGFPEIALMEDIALSKKLRSVCRPLCIHERIVVSARRWQRNGVVRTIALMWRLRVAYFFGGDPRKLGAAYAATRTQS